MVPNPEWQVGLIWISLPSRIIWCFHACSWSWSASAPSAASTLSRSSPCASRTRSSRRCYLKSGTSMSDSSRHPRGTLPLSANLRTGTDRNIGFVFRVSRKKDLRLMPPRIPKHDGSNLQIGCQIESVARLEELSSSLSSMQFGGVVMALCPADWDTNLMGRLGQRNRITNLYAFYFYGLRIVHTWFLSLAHFVIEGETVLWWDCAAMVSVAQTC